MRWREGGISLLQPRKLLANGDEPPEVRILVILARALALCAGHTTQKNVLVTKMLSVLGGLRDDDYFDDPKRLAAFRQDKDFASVRDHPDFATFTRSLTKD